MSAAAPRVVVLTTGESHLPDAVREAGGEPVSFYLPPERLEGGVALAREWVADVAQVSCAAEDFDALMIAADEPADLAGLVVAAARLNLPTVVEPEGSSLSVALSALGLSPLGADPAETVVEISGSGRPRVRELVGEFSLANALRAGISAGGGPEMIVHLTAIAREARAPGFLKMVRVLVPETAVLAEPGSEWLTEHGTAGLLAHLGEAIHDGPTVEGRLLENLPPAPPAPTPSGARLSLVRGRASGAEALCRSSGEAEVSGDVRFFRSEKPAVQALEKERVEPGSLLVVGAAGPRSGPGLLRLDGLARVLDEEGLMGTLPVLTDGIAPDRAGGVWISLFTPETVEDGILSRLRDGDPLRIDLEEGRLRAGIVAREISDRHPRRLPERRDAGYAARYARSARSAFEGAGFQ
ncbi:MAG: dihydroxy-acid dehydratase [Rubrobacter sp.]|nr:dihydroxy-acid dehydratase [Rubrobacter sp.]